MVRFLCLIWALVLPSFAVEGDFRWNGRLAPGQTVEIKGVSGSIHAEFVSGSETRVTARKSAERGDPNAVHIEAVPHAGGITICTVYSAEGGHPSGCGPTGEVHPNPFAKDVKVEYTVQLPRGVRLAARTVNGEVLATDLQSDVEVATVNGRVRIGTTGSATAKTVNGSIEVSIGTGTLSQKSPLEFSTVNGSIDVTVPPGVSADVHASTVNGGLTTDFPLTVSGRWGPKSLTGRIGNGGALLKMSTVNGGIRLHSTAGRTI